MHFETWWQHLVYCYPQHKVCYRLRSLKNQSHSLWNINHPEKRLNNKGPNRDPWGTPDKTSSHELKSEFMLVLCLRFGRYFCTNHKAVMLNPYAFSLAIKSSSERQSNVFDRSVRSAPNIFLLSIADPNIDNRQCCKLYPLKRNSWQNTDRSVIFFWAFWIFLWTGVIFASFNK